MKNKTYFTKLTNNANIKLHIRIILFIFTYFNIIIRHKFINLCQSTKRQLLRFFLSSCLFILNRILRVFHDFIKIFIFFSIQQFITCKFYSNCPQWCCYKDTKYGNCLHYFSSCNSHLKRN